MITVNVIRPPLKTSRGSLRCFELEKCQVESPPVRVAQSLAQSSSTPRRHRSYAWENFLVTFKNIGVKHPPGQFSSSTQLNSTDSDEVFFPLR